MIGFIETTSYYSLPVETTVSFGFILSFLHENINKIYARKMPEK